MHLKNPILFLSLLEDCMDAKENTKDIESNVLSLLKKTYSRASVKTAGSRDYLRVSNKNKTDWKVKCHKILV